MRKNKMNWKMRKNKMQFINLINIKKKKMYLINMKH